MLSRADVSVVDEVVQGLSQKTESGRKAAGSRLAGCCSTRRARGSRARGIDPGGGRVLVPGGGFGVLFVHITWSVYSLGTEYKEVHERLRLTIYHAQP